MTGRCLLSALSHTPFLHIRWMQWCPRSSHVVRGQLSANKCENLKKEENRLVTPKLFANGGISTGEIPHTTIDGRKVCDLILLKRICPQDGNCNYSHYLIINTSYWIVLKPANEIGFYRQLKVSNKYYSITTWSVSYTHLTLPTIYSV